MVFFNNKKGYVALVLPLVILFIVGLPFVWTVIKFVNSPVISGSIPVWVIILIGLFSLFVYKNRYRWGLVKDRSTKRYF